MTKCDVCGGLIDGEDLFCGNCGTEAPPPQTPVAAMGTYRSTHNFECRGCGASMSYDASAKSLRCPFCGSQKMAQQGDSDTLAAELVVPFQLDQDQASATLRQWLGRGFWRPGDLAKIALITKMTRVYVPYWVFRADTYTYWTADSSQTPAGARADWYPVTGKRRGQHEGLLVGASSVLTPNETHAICPFDLGAGVPPAQVDLENVVVEQFCVQRKYARPLAWRELNALEKQACAQLVPGRHRNLQVNVRLENLAGRAVLLPVWIVAYGYRDRVFRFLINGQTGRATGQAPTSWRKVSAVVAIVLLVIAALTVFAILA